MSKALNTYTPESRPRVSVWLALLGDALRSRARGSAVLCFCLWTMVAAVFAAHSLPSLPPERSEVALEYGKNAGRGNLLGIQPFMEPADYRTLEAFYTKLDQYLALAEDKGWINRRTVVAFPEVIGFYLVAVNERDEIYRAKTLQEAALLMIHARISEPGEQGSASQTGDSILVGRRMLLAAKAPLMAGVYQEVFSKLASKYQVTVVAGSILLPAPSVRNGTMVCDTNGPIRNVSAVFQPDGTIYPQLVFKAFPTREEVQELGVTRGIAKELPVFETPAGLLGVLICADSWYPAAYETLDRKGAQIIATVSKLGDKDHMRPTWHGYSLSPGIQAPDDVDQRDIGKLSEGQAWQKYAMPGRMGGTPKRSSSAEYGMTVFTRGRFWEESTPGGDTFVVSHGKYLTREDQNRPPGVVCLWLD